MPFHSPDRCRLAVFYFEGLLFKINEWISLRNLSPLTVGNKLPFFDMLFFPLLSIQGTSWISKITLKNQSTPNEWLSGWSCMSQLLDFVVLQDFVSIVHRLSLETLMLWLPGGNQQNCSKLFPCIFPHTSTLVFIHMNYYLLLFILGSNLALWIFIWKVISSVIA